LVPWPQADQPEKASELRGSCQLDTCCHCSNTREIRQAQPNSLLGLHHPGRPWLKWGCPIDGCGQWFLASWDLEWHTEAEDRADNSLVRCC
jgi:hypothetical protein